MRKIPATMATQHPDNAFAPPGGKSPFISTIEEVDECYHAFSDFGCDEYMWDWEGKFVDEAVVDRLFNRYNHYFQKHQLGREKFLTFRIPNVSYEAGFRLARSYMTLITAAHTAREHQTHIPPIFEAILPMTTKASQLLAIYRKYLNALKFEQAIFDKALMKPDDLEMIPLIEGSVTLLHSRHILNDYISGYKKLFGRPPPYLRPFIARSDPALDSGFLAAVLSARGAISEYYRFEEETGIRVFPIIGVGSLPFRGGLSPVSIDSFLKNYAGVRTVTIQSAFRYDYPIDIVKKSLAALKTRLPHLTPRIFSKKEIGEILELSKFFASYYRPVIISLSKTIRHLATFIPSHRERIQHTGHFGYSRKMGDKTKLPRAITFCAVFSSLGVPASLIGSGRALMAFKKEKGRRADLLLSKYFPTLESDLKWIGSYLNWENLKFLSKHDHAWKTIFQDVTAIEEMLGSRLGPSKPHEYIHRNLTSNIYQLWKNDSQNSKNKKEITEEILRAARVRRSLG